LFYAQGSKDQFKYYKCTNCHLVNLDLQGKGNIENQEKYGSHNILPKDYNKVKESLDSFDFVSKYVHTKGKYLDIGCGFGSVLYFFRKNGWEVKGLELSLVLADHVKSTLQIDVEVSDFLLFEGNSEKCDLVSLRHVLEHLPDSVLAMKKISGILKKNGYAHFEFPNINGFSHRLQRFRNRIRFLRKEYSADYLPGHCNEFSRYTFAYLLKQTGFQLIRWETYSRKPLSNFIYNHFHFGTKARAIVQKIE
jgi:SAM-dependent methyltransferase